MYGASWKICGSQPKASYLEPLGPLTDEPFIIKLNRKVDSAPDTATMRCNAGGDDALELMESDCCAQQGTLFGGGIGGKIVGVLIATLDKRRNPAPGQEHVGETIVCPMFAFDDKVVSEEPL